MLATIRIKIFLSHPSPIYKNMKIKIYGL